MPLDVPGGLAVSNCSETSRLSIVSSATTCQDNSAKDFTISGTICGVMTSVRAPAHSIDPCGSGTAQAHQDEDYGKLHIAIFFRSWFCISLLRCSARHQLFPAVQAQRVQELPAHPLLQTWTDRQGLNAPNRHFPLIRPPM